MNEIVLDTTKQKVHTSSVCENRPRVATRTYSKNPLTGALDCDGTLCVPLLPRPWPPSEGFFIDRTLVADSAAGMWESRYCGFRLETAERVAKAAPLVERLPGTCGSEGDTFKANLDAGMARFCSPKAIA